MPKIIDPAPGPPVTSSAQGFDLSGSAVAGRSLVDFRRVLFARKFLILIVVAAAIILSIIYAQTRTPLYEATATAEVDLPRSQSLGLSSAVGSLYGDDATTAVQTQAFRLTGHSLVYRAIAELAAEHRGPFPNAFNGIASPSDEDALPPSKRSSMIGTVLGSLSVGIVPKTNALRVTYRHRDPIVARDFVNRLAHSLHGTKRRRPPARHDTGI